MDWSTPLKLYYPKIKSLPCTICGKEPLPWKPTEVDHIRPPSLKGDWYAPRTHQGPGAWWCIPLCRDCHRERHRHREEDWYLSKGWERKDLDYLVRKLWYRYAPEEVISNLEGLYGEYFSRKGIPDVDPRSEG